MIGASPSEAPGGDVGRRVARAKAPAPRRCSCATAPKAGWSLGPGLLNGAGQPLAGFKLDQPEGALGPSPLAGQMTPQGGGVLLGTRSPSKAAAQQQVVLVRKPGRRLPEDRRAGEAKRLAAEKKHC